MSDWKPQEIKPTGGKPDLPNRGPQPGDVIRTADGLAVVLSHDAARKFGKKTGKHTVSAVIAYLRAPLAPVPLPEKYSFEMR